MMACANNPIVRVSLDDGAYLPVRAHKTDAGADIRTPVTVRVPARGSAIVHTGVHVETPCNCVSMLKSKSGINIRNGITSEGVIDEGFTGEIVVKLYNHGEQPVLFERGDKISQLVIMPVVYPTYEQVDRIAGGDRGDNGYGSTGR